MEADSPLVGMSIAEVEAMASTPLVLALKTGEEARLAPPADQMIWVGTVQEKRVAGEAALYRLAADHSCERLLGGITVANGIAWSPDDRSMYLADSHVREIYAFAVDAREGALGERRLFARFA